MNRIMLAVIFLLSFIGASTAQSQDMPSAHVMVTPTDLKWADAPPSLPRGAKMVVMEGELSKPGPFTFRIKLPDNYKVPAHSHPVLEHVTVLSGTFIIGMGDKLAPEKGKELAAGGFMVIPPKTNHFVAGTKGETIIQIHGFGPWGITYVNPADDPRKK